MMRVVCSKVTVGKNTTAPTSSLNTSHHQSRTAAAAAAATNPRHKHSASLSLLFGGIVSTTTVVLSMTNVSDAMASGLERDSLDLPLLQNAEQGIGIDLKEWREKNQAVIDSAESQFENSELLATLRQRTAEHKEERERELRDLYCRRQAELGVGDCAGLRLIPGATKSGLQKTPEWVKSMSKIFNGEGDSDSE